jgi:hypothetical protein
MTETEPPRTTIPPAAEAILRVVWPAVTRFPAVATVARLLMRPLVTAPLAGLLLAPFYFGKVLPGFAVRYTLTNRRLAIQRGLQPRSVREVALAEIDDVVIRRDANSAFYRAGTLEVVGRGEIRLVLPGVPYPDAFRQAILHACMAWSPGRAAAWLKFLPARPVGT